MKFSDFVYTLLKWIFSLIQFLLIIMAVFLAYIAITDYDPPKTQPLGIMSPQDPPAHAPADSSITLISWNIGYGGLGNKMDFFYDGGHRVRPDSNEYQTYFQGITTFLARHDSIDFFLLQEVDKHSKRSWRNDQTASIRQWLPHYYSVFSKNYDVRFVPLPPAKPMGSVKAGMMTLSKTPIDSAIRLALPDAYSWPMKHFMLDRAAIITHHHVFKNKSLVVINLHNSAYVDDSLALAKEVAVIRDYAQTQYHDGNYVIIGGDWNQNPPGYRASDQNQRALAWQLDTTVFKESWQWAYDTLLATNRNLSTPYDSSSIKTTIDFFVVSPNVSLQQVKVIGMDFSYSDHEPVYLRVTLKHH